ncbi:MAG: sugar transferase [Solirubrobacteraceae bacterium]
MCGVARIAKHRGEDVSGAPATRVPCLDILLIVLAAPLILLLAAAIALAIYLDSPGPVIYRSRRIGRGGKPFEMLKFRKMRRDCSGGPLTRSDDERFTPIGRFLSSTRLDELPQVLNVLKGQMRLVGPRPEDPGFVAQFSEQYREILDVCPGITGPSQLRFLDEHKLLAGAEDASEAYCREVLPQKIGIDIRYARTRSPAGDLKILARTAALPLRMVLQTAKTRLVVLRAWAPVASAAVLLVATFVLSAGTIS